MSVYVNPLYKKRLTKSTSSVRTASDISVNLIPSPIEHYHSLKRLTKAELKARQEDLTIHWSESLTKDKMLRTFLVAKYHAATGTEATYMNWTVGALRSYVTTELNTTVKEVVQTLGEAKKSDWVHLAMLVDILAPAKSAKRTEIQKLTEFLETNFRKCR